jgi:hypothetical protein
MVGSVSLQSAARTTPIYVGSHIIDEEPVSVMAFGTAKDLGVEEDNTKVHFYTGYTETKNAQIAGAELAGINGSSWAVYPRGYVKVSFDLSPQDLQKNLGLYLTHRSASSGRGNLQPNINVLVNGHLFTGSYVPNNHDWIANDQMMGSAKLSSFLVHGRNEIHISVQADTRYHSRRANDSQYLIHSLMIK